MTPNRPYFGFFFRTLQRRAGQLFLAIPLLIGILSCASNKSTYTVRFMASELHSRLQMPKLEIAELGEIYSLTDSSGEQTFFTGLSECGAAAKGDPTSLLRQLYVGFTQLRIIQFKRVDNIPAALKTIASASLDRVPLKLVSYSIKNNTCLLDLIFWSSIEQDQNLSDNEIIKWADKVSTIHEKIFAYAVSLTARGNGPEVK